jgi:hypothetical protein
MGYRGVNPDWRVQREVTLWSRFSGVKRLSGVSGQSLNGSRAAPLPSESPLTTLVVIVGYIMGKPIPSLQAVDGTSTSISILAAK